jgi:hypothetical protein
MLRSKLLIVVVGPSTDRTFGSLLRPLNIYYSLRNLKNCVVKYVSVPSVALLFSSIRLILAADIVVVSGVNPWVSALTVFVRRLLSNGITLVDFHSFAWYESVVTRSSAFPRKILLFVSELLLYRLATRIIVASKWLANTLAKSFGKKDVFVLENTTSYIFENLVGSLTRYPKRTIWRIMCSRIPSLCNDKKILLTPLPEVFASNVMAEELLKNILADLPQEVVVVVTGSSRKGVFYGGKLIYVGYIPYPEYVALLMLAYGVLLPYPSNAICGGARNKILEAGYMGISLYSTKTGVLHLPFKSWKHYIPVDNLGDLVDLLRSLDTTTALGMALNSREIIERRYTFKSFKRTFLGYFLDLLGSARGHEGKLHPQ